jgi:excinuclease ABC subunit C
VDNQTQKEFNVKAFLASLPLSPGVYRMLDARGQVLYVGKAGQLKKRVASYFQKTNISPRTRLMVSHIARIEVTVTRSEAEALLLENNLIKTLKPRYNILFRDDKSYPYIVLTGHKFPRLTYYRGATAKQHQYYGPYPNSHAAKESLNLLQKVFRIRTCEDSVFNNRTRPCLLHQIHRCNAPCVGLITIEDYATSILSASLLLQGKQGEVEGVLRKAMEQAADSQRYEQAAALRDQLQSLHTVQQKQFMESGRATDADIVAVAELDGVLCVNLAMVRGGKHLGDKSFFPQNIHLENADEQLPAEVLEAFLAQHYLNRSVPSLILTGIEITTETLEQLLGEQAGHKVQIRQSVSGERKQWLDMALNNAMLALRQQAGQQAGQSSRLAALRAALSLPKLSRIECFDISHTMGEATIASCVVYDNLASQNTEYRRYNISGITAGDDYAAMRQALLRRYLKLQAGEGKRPDLILIDGGAGQLGIACEVMTELGLTDIALMGVAKGVERKPGMEQLLLPQREKPLQLPPDSPALHLIQQIRDEAHRFAISGHRAKRGKTRTASMLEEISGVGERRRRNLLARFGGLPGVRQASVDELAQVEGISRVLAEKIYQQLH